MAENIEKCSGVSTIKFKSCKTGCETCAVDTETKIYYKDGKPFKVVIEQLWDRTRYRFYPNTKRIETEMDLVSEPHYITCTTEKDKKIILEHLSAAAEAVKDNNKPEFVKQTIEDIKKQITDLKIKRNTGFTHEGV